MTHEPRTIVALVLVFAAYGGVRGALISSAKKLFQVNGRDSLGVAVEYLHRDELPPAIAEVVGDAMLCVLAKTAKGHEPLMGPDVLERCQGNVDDFKGRLRHHATRLGLTLPPESDPLSPEEFLDSLEELQPDILSDLEMRIIKLLIEHGRVTGAHPLRVSQATEHLIRRGLAFTVGNMNGELMLTSRGRDLAISWGLVA